jgi:type IV secretion system protein VirB10
MSTPDQNGLQPLEGEAGIPPVTEEKSLNVSAKAIFAVLLLGASVVTGGTLLVRRATAPDAAKVEAKELAEAPKPVSVTSARPKVEAPADPPPQAASAPVPTIPELEPEDDVKPIPVREAGTSNAAPQRPKLDPMDAPLMIVSDAKAVRTAAPHDADAVGNSQPRDDGLDETRANLNQYRQQLQGMLGTLQGMTNQVQGGGAPAGGPPAAATAAGPNPQAAADLASTLTNQASKGTPRVSATTLANRSLTLPRGTTFTCALKTQVIASASGPISCQVTRHVYSDDGRILLVERGSHLDGE